jgi:tRNA threonylcarbamoyladenosine modification (KEOPS) complex  Pcc1 subunit
VIRLKIPFHNAEPVTHVLLFDTETVQQIRELGENARLVCNCYRSLFSIYERLDSDSMASKYKVVFAVPQANSLATACQDGAALLRAAGIKALVLEIKAEDMSPMRGKIGRLCSVGWCVAGSVLLNEVPITKDQGEALLFRPARLGHGDYDQQLVLLKHWWLNLDFKVGLLRSTATIGHLLRGAVSRFPDRHSVSHILQAMKTNCSREDFLVIGFKET